MNKPFVAILMGSQSDLSTLEHCFEILKTLEIPFEANILSAHRTPNETQKYIGDAQSRGCAVFIAAAGLAAHLAGAVAAHCLRPVIGIPLAAGELKGMDALLATVQMPAGMPVACMGIGKHGARNAAILAAQILAISDTNLHAKLQQFRDNKKQEILSQNTQLHSALSEEDANVT